MICNNTCNFNFYGYGRCNRNNQGQHSNLMITLLSSLLVEESVRLFAAGVILAVEVYRTAKNREMPKNQSKHKK